MDILSIVVIAVIFIAIALVINFVVDAREHNYAESKIFQRYREITTIQTALQTSTDIIEELQDKVEDLQDEVRGLQDRLIMLERNGNE